MIGPLADVYSLGAILYTMLVGRPPFQSASIPAMLIQVLERDPVSPRHLTPDVPRDLETVCLKCLRKELSGKTGETLWRKEVRSDVIVEEKVGQIGMTTVKGKESLGPPLITDINGDEIRDILWPTFAWRGDDYSGIGDFRPRAIEAISGKTGEEIWQTPLEVDWFRFEAEVDGRTPHHVTEHIGRVGSEAEWKLPGTPERVVIDDEERLVAAAGSRIVLLDPATGRLDGSPIELKNLSVRPLKILDRGNGDPAALAVVYDGRKARSGREGSSLPDHLSLWSLSERQELWTTAGEPSVQDGRRDSYGSGGVGAFRYPAGWIGTDWPLLVDMNGDEQPEILLPVMVSGRPGRTRLEIREAVSGKHLGPINPFAHQTFLGDLIVHSGQRPLLLAVVGEALTPGVALSGSAPNPQILTLEGESGQERGLVRVGGETAAAEMGRYHAFNHLFASPLVDEEGWPLVFLRELSLAMALIPRSSCWAGKAEPSS